LNIEAPQLIQVIQAKREHIDLIANWQVAMALESEGMQLDLPTVQSGVTRVFDDPSTGYYLVAAKNEVAVGCCLVLREWSDWRNGTVLWIHSVYTHPDYRRHGVFASIYAYLKKKVAETSTLRGLRLYVDKANEPAMTAYKNLGMTAEHYHLYEWMKEST
jgi:GNAT superfamily N-acetyltransferase